VNLFSITLINTIIWVQIAKQKYSNSSFNNIYDICSTFRSKVQQSWIIYLIQKEFVFYWNYGIYLACKSFSSLKNLLFVQMSDSVYVSWLSSNEVLGFLLSLISESSRQIKMPHRGYMMMGETDWSTQCYKWGASFLLNQRLLRWVSGIFLVLVFNNLI
jgi:hypothetical protein